MKDFEADKLSPSLVMDTCRSYGDSQAICGRIIHHDRDHGDQEAKLRRVQCSTKIFHEARFGEKPSDAMWDLAFSLTPTSVESSERPNHRACRIHARDDESIDERPTNRPCRRCQLSEQDSTNSDPKPEETVLEAGSTPACP